MKKIVTSASKIWKTYDVKWKTIEKNLLWKMKNGNRLSKILDEILEQQLGFLGLRKALQSCEVCYI